MVDEYQKKKKKAKDPYIRTKEIFKITMESS